MENLWDNGFTAGKYEIIDLSLQNQVGLDILSKYFMSLLVKKDNYFYLDDEKRKTALKNRKIVMI